MVSKMTPGPWMVDDPGKNYPEIGCSIRSSDPTFDLVADEVHGRADAQAIAALPDLIEAAQLIMNAGMGSDQERAGIFQLHDALKKAGVE